MRNTSHFFEGEACYGMMLFYIINSVRNSVTMSNLISNQSPLTWDAFYSEAALLKSAVRLYTKPLFNQRQLWQTSVTDENFFDFARHGLKNLEQFHRQL